VDVREIAEVLAQARQWQTLVTPGDQESYEGSDQTETVTAHVDASGVLTSFTIGERWSGRLEPRSMGDAIREAAAAALAARYGFSPPATGAAAIDWRAAFPAMTAATVPVTDDDMRQAETQVADAASRLEQESSRSSIEGAREHYLSQLDKLLSTPLPSYDQARRHVLVGSPMQIELEFAAGGLLIGCTVNAHWVASQSGNTLTMRIGELLTEHRDGRQAF
jgi:hypothetical protein